MSKKLNAELDVLLKIINFNSFLLKQVEMNMKISIACGYIPSEDMISFKYRLIEQQLELMERVDSIISQLTALDLVV